MEELKIELINGATSVRELYFKERSGTILTYNKTRDPLLFITLFFILSVILYFVVVNVPMVIWIFLFVVCSTLVLIGIIYLIPIVRKYLIWKRSVDGYLKMLAKYESQWLTLTDNCIELVNIDETTVDKWENVKHVSMLSDYIYMKLQDDTMFLFPAKSMVPEQFDKLKDFVRKRMNILN